MLTPDQIELLTSYTEAEATDTEGHIDRALHRKALARDIAEAIDDLLANDADAQGEIINSYAENLAARQITSLRRKRKVRLSETQQRLFWDPDAILTVEENVDITVARSTGADWVRAAVIHQRNARAATAYATAYGEIAAAFQNYPGATIAADAPDVVALFDTDTGGEL